jgi:hypothetical protein
MNSTEVIDLKTITTRSQPVKRSREELPEP